MKKFLNWLANIPVIRKHRLKKYKSAQADAIRDIYHLCRQLEAEVPKLEDLFRIGCVYHEPAKTANKSGPSATVFITNKAAKAEIMKIDFYLPNIFSKENMRIKIYLFENFEAKEWFLSTDIENRRLAQSISQSLNVVAGSTQTIST